MKHTLFFIFLMSALTALADDYAVSAGKDARQTNTSRTLNGIVLNSPSDGTQTISIDQSGNRMLYQNVLSKAFTARPGERLTPSFAWSGSWMSGYVYIDYGNDGEFQSSVLANGVPAEGSDIVAYSFYQGHNSVGDDVSSGNVLNPPSFTLPADLKPGVYRMRYKVDWDFLEASGNNSSNNDIIKNGGAIADTRLIVHGDSVSISLLTSDDTHQPKLTATAPFGKGTQIALGQLIPSGKAVRAVAVRHGYNLAGESTLHGTPQYTDDTLSFLAISNNQLTIPASMVDGDMVLTLQLCESTGDDDQVINTVPSPEEVTAGLAITKLRIAGTRTKNFSGEEPDARYQDFRLLAPVPVLPGKSVALSLTGTHVANGDTVALSLNDAQLYIDLNGDGTFSSLLERQPSATTLTLPATLQPGTYNARLYLPADSAMMDFTILAHKSTVSLRVETPNGRLVGKSLYNAGGLKISGKGVPDEIAAYKQASFNALPLVMGYSAEGAQITVKSYDGTESHFTLLLSKPSYSFTIPADSIYGDITIVANFAPNASTSSKTQRKPVLIEEFNGSELNDNLWTTSTRYSSAWNRFIVDDSRVAFVKDGHLVCRCFANPGDISGYSGQMVSGAKETQGNFAFNHGYIEARIFTNPHTGNFPAFWLMPADQSDGWPTCGEIDIWETINTESRSYSTVHTHWTYDLGNGGNGSNRACNHEGQWHTFGLLKEANKLTWYVDGDQVFTYSKSTSANQLNQGQWPFDKAFYIILNQSVGNGSWAAGPDPSFTYETHFDWVRVYQTEEEAQNDGNTLLGIEQAETAPVQLPTTDKRIYDLSGRPINQPVKGQFYISNGRVRLYK